MSKMRTLIASVMLLFLLVSAEPAFSHSGGQMILDVMRAASLIIVMTKMTMTSGALLRDSRKPAEASY